MKQIRIGTCIQGSKAEEWLPGFLGRGFETFSINFHMSLEGTDLEKLALKTEKLLSGSGSRISTIGYYCNPISGAPQDAGTCDTHGESLRGGSCQYLRRCVGGASGGGSFS